MAFRKAIITLAIGLCMPLHAAAQEIPYIKNHSPDAMQAGNQNWSVAQAPSRDLYIANSAGLVQYDGARWKLLPLPNRQIARASAADAQGRIFCGGFGEFGYWKPDRNGMPEYFSLSDSIKNDKASREEIWHILLFEGKAYFQSFSALYRFDYKKLEELPVPGNIMFMQDAGGRALLPVIGQGIFEKDKNDRFTLLPGTEMLGDKIVVGMLPLRNGGLLIGAEQGGLFYWRHNQLRIWETPVQKELAKSRLNKMLLLSDGNIVLGSVGEGLYIITQEGKVLYHIHRGVGLQNNTILSLMQDADSNLWVGMDKGLDILALSSPLRFSIDRSGNIGTVFTACRWKDKLYLGTNQGLFHRSATAAGNLDADINWIPVRGLNGQVWELTVIGNQLLCGHNDGSFLIENGTATKISEVTGGWVTKNCPWDKNILVQGTYTGLIVFRKNEQQGLQFSHRISGFDQPVEFMSFDATGNLWAAHPYRGLHRIELNKDLTAVTEARRITPADGIPTDFNLALTEINGQILLRAGGQFFHFNNKARRWELYNPGQGLALKGGERALLPAGDKGAWFAVFNDKVILQEPGTQQAVFSLRLPNDRPNILALTPEIFLFCLEDGYALWDRKSGSSAPAGGIGSVRITELNTNGAGRRIAQPQDADQEAILKSYENHLSFFFSATRFDQKPAYRWRMVGLQDDWSEWQESSIQEFSYLPAGAYRFEVQSDQSDQTAVFRFRIRPRWYLTWYFKLLYILAGAGGIGVLMIWRFQQLERRHRRQMLERERRLHQQRIQERNEQLQEDVLKKAKDLANSTMHLIRKNEVLLEIKQRFSSVKQGQNTAMAVQQLNHLVEQELSSENDWAVFEENFNQVHEAFLRKMKQAFPDLTPGDLRLAAYLKMNLSSKEIAPLLGISIRGVENKRYRLRKKMNLPNDENLVEFLLDF